MRMTSSVLPLGRLIDVGGFRLHINGAGHGSPSVVFESALGGSSLSWTLVQADVARFTRACSYDRAGFGWSDAGPLPRTAGRIADELRLLLDRAGEAPPYVLVGHSFGGLVMQVFATRFRRDTAALVLVDPAHPEDWVTPAPKEKLKIDRGVRLCRQGAVGARLGLARVAAALVGAGAISPARAIAKLVSRGGWSVEDEGILAPIWKLPAEARRPLRYLWSQPKFFEALGSQIESICVSAAQALEAATAGYGALPLVTISSTNPSDYRRRQQDALARLSTRGQHIVASSSGHWIPLDQPEVVIQVIRDTLYSSRSSSCSDVPLA